MATNLIKDFPGIPAWLYILVFLFLQVLSTLFFQVLSTLFTVKVGNFFLDIVSLLLHVPDLWLPCTFSAEHW